MADTIFIVQHNSAFFDFDPIACISQNLAEAICCSDCTMYQATRVQDIPNGRAVYYSPDNDQYYQTYELTGDNILVANAIRAHRPARISIDHGQTFQTPKELFARNGDFILHQKTYWAQIVDHMDSAIREQLANRFGDCDEYDFLCAYCAEAEEDICIG